MNSKKSNGRSFLGTLFLIAVGFAAGFYHAEILAFGQKIVENIRK